MPVKKKGDDANLAAGPKAELEKQFPFMTSFSCKIKEPFLNFHKVQFSFASVSLNGVRHTQARILNNVC